MNEGNTSPFARPATGFAGQPQPSTQEQTYVDGFRPGDIKYSYGVLALLLQVNPGWYLADGTVTLQDGTTPPDLTGRFIIGANGTTFALGQTGGSDAHVHPFTHEAAHAITQPVFAAPAAHAITQPVFTASGGTLSHTNNHTAHTNNHAGTAVAAHQNHGAGLAGGPVQIATGLGGIYVWVTGSAADATAMLAHNANHTVTQPTAHGEHTGHDDHSLASISLTRTVDVALTNNHAAPARTTDVALSNNAPHSGGSVDAATGDNRFPKYAALWPLIKKF